MISDEVQRKALIKHAQESERASRLSAMVELARSEAGIPIGHDDLDRDPRLLNCENGTLELRTGCFREHRPSDLITKLAPVTFHPDAEAPVWNQFLLDIFAGDSALIDSLQRLLGYCLTGDVSEQILPIFHGCGANGKSTLRGAILAMLGMDYAIKAAPDLIMIKRGSHPTERADLHGKRVVTVVETEEGRRLAESLVKDLTGGDRIRARRMREDFWEFTPSHKVILACNHKPTVRGTDHAIWRRIRLVPFDVTILDDEQDKTLPEKLRGELPGILRWCVEGCLLWQHDGLGTPDKVTIATAEYREGEDTFGAFLQECCVVAPNTRARASVFFQIYKYWCEPAGESPVKQRRFGDALSERGFDPHKSGGVIWRHGVGLRDDDDQETA